MNLTNKFIVIILFITSLVISVFTYLQITEQKDILNNELDQRVSLIRSNLESNAKYVIKSLKNEVENDIASFNFSHIHESFKQLVERKEIDTVVLFNIDGSKQLLAGDKRFIDQLSKKETGNLNIEMLNSENNFVISAPIVLSDKWGMMHIVYSLDTLKEEITQTEKNIDNKIKSSVKKGIYTSVTLALILIFLSYFFAKKVISPILLLTQTAKEIANGDLDVSDRLVAIKTDDEIGLLAKSFKDMSKKLDTSYKDLKASNKELELKTKQLQELNASLEEKVAQKVAKITEQENLMIAQSRLAAMGEMISMIAHQWRQPLSTTTLMITNEKVKSMMEGKETSEYDNILDKISDTMLYLSDTIDDFQTYFKPGKDTEKILTSTIITRVQDFIEQRLILSKVQLHIQKCDKVYVETYANELMQVLINILNNAIDALIETKVDERHIWVTLHNENDNVKISIEDNAGGIKNDVIEKVFEPYFSTKSKNGTGLGLYMAKMIIDKHIGGLLHVDNTKNGALFTIILPKKINSAKP